jgi:hypothetical protein
MKDCLLPDIGSTAAGFRWHNGSYLSKRQDFLLGGGDVATSALLSRSPPRRPCLCRLRGCAAAVSLAIEVPRRSRLTPRCYKSEGRIHTAARHPTPRRPSSRLYPALHPASHTPLLICASSLSSLVSGSSSSLPRCLPTPWWVPMLVSTFYQLTDSVCSHITRPDLQILCSSQQAKTESGLNPVTLEQLCCCL